MLLRRLLSCFFARPRCAGLLAGLALLAGWPATAAAADTPLSRLLHPARPKVALVLSGGGARGLSHVGVLQVLEAARVPVDMVVGTSMGAIVGGLYAAGMSPQALQDEVVSLDWGGIFQRSEPRQLLSQRRKEEDFELAPLIELGFRDGEFRLPTGAVSTRSLELLLRRYTLGARHLASFDGLPIPFRAVATDMETGEPIVMDHGDLAAALRASMSVPGVFSPLEVNGRILGDGGLVNNLPVDVARRMGADVIIAVNIGTPLAGRETLGTLVGITTQMVNILTEQNVRRSMDMLTKSDLLLLPDLGTITSASFDRAEDLVKIGRDYAESVRQALDRFAVTPEAYAAWQAHRQTRLTQEQGADSWVSQVRFEGVEQDRIDRVRQLVDSEAGQPLDVQRVEQDLRTLAATGDFDRVDYRLDRLHAESGEALVIRLRENDWGPNYLRMGLDLRTDFEGQSAFNLRLSHNRRWINRYGAEWRNLLQLGQTSVASTEFYQPLGRDGTQFLSAYLSSSLRRVDLFEGSGEAAASLSRTHVDLGLDYGWPLGVLGHLGEARVGLLSAWRQTSPKIISTSLSDIDPAIWRQRWRDNGLRFSLVSDQLDYANFPTSGYRLRGELIGGRRLVSGQPSSSFVKMDLTATGAITWGRDTLNLGFRAARASRLAIGSIDEFSLGGFQQLSGFRIGQVSGNMLAFGRLTYYHRLPWNSPLTRALFVGGSLEAGNAWLRRRDASWNDLLVGRSLFVGADTALGPLYLSVVSAPRGYTGLYLFLGRP